ncbi:VTT domain-containing protein [Paraconexibacter antarcticus]|uniref:TVP38/TMEM64 family membrane protein n=1 Tax=Paraconexibacter antarcticus TaxID=2949664 RepID=A0ABY5DX79_9ACTN|nr:VTT domain-containing protein [Paraconexibacter antarcticus]UTI65492.1 VTT domain-containing protein [Paraconexibacter antarcticus]
MPDPVADPRPEPAAAPGGAAPAPAVVPGRSGDAGWLGLGLTVAALVLAALVILAIPALREAASHALHGDGELLRRQLRDLGAVGVLVLVAVMLVHAVVFFPAELVSGTAGYVYGFLPAIPIVLGGWLLSGVASYWIGQHAGRPLLRSLAGGHRLERAEAAVARGGAGALLAARLIPVVPYSLVGYVAGAARVPFLTFAWTSLVGNIPISLVVIAVGTRLRSFSLSDPVVWLAVVPVLIAAVVVHRISRVSRRGGDDARDAGAPGAGTTR